MRFRVLKDESMADVALEAFGKTESELFENAAFALFEQMADTKKIGKSQKSRIAVKDPDLERLLYGFLSDIVFRKDTERTVFSAIEAKVFKKGGEWIGQALLTGQKVADVLPSVLRTDVKAVTFYGFKISKTKSGLKVKIVLDI
ncbi:MAG: archease [Candidatus Micrarchaeota archaeon]